MHLRDGVRLNTIFRCTTGLPNKTCHTLAKQDICLPGSLYLPSSQHLYTYPPSYEDNGPAPWLVHLPVRTFRILIQPENTLAAIVNIRDELPEDAPPYGYIPTQYVAILFIALYSISSGEFMMLSMLDRCSYRLSAVHLGQAVKFRMWWATWTILAFGLLEIAGWSGRMWSNLNIMNGSAFQLQYVYVKQAAKLPTLIQLQNYYFNPRPNTFAGLSFHHFRSSRSNVGSFLQPIFPQTLFVSFIIPVCMS